MTVSVLGMGYVGTVVAVSLARRGHAVIGVDIDPAKLDLLRGGKAPFAEPGLDDALAEALPDLRVSDDTTAAVAASQVVIVCVGTPTGADGRPDLRALDRVTEEIGAGLREPGPGPRTVVLRSTVPPGTTRERFVPRLAEASGRAHGDGWHAIFSPEFLREGAALRDVAEPPITVLGATEPAHAQPYLELLGGAHGHVAHTAMEAAELVKYAANAFHALKVAFGNEIGALAHSHGVDGRAVMELLCRDTVLNVSPAYLRPGTAFGGSCLPKDLRALERDAAKQRLTLPLVSAVLPSNAAQLRRLVQAVIDTGARTVGVVGLAFKAGTDDLRESPMLELVRSLLLDGREVWIHDAEVRPQGLSGRNLLAAKLGLPALDTRMLGTVDEVVERCDAVVLARRIDPALASALQGKAILDVAGNDALAELAGYDAVAW